MEFLESSWLLVGAFFLSFIGLFFFGIKIGRKWGKENALQWLKLKVHSTITIRLGHPLSYLTAPDWDGKLPRRIQGVLDLNFAELQDKDMGFPVGFKFTPDKTQWKPCDCCPPPEKPPLAA